MKQLSPIAFVAASIIGLATLLSAAVLLPHDRYYRYQAHNSVTTRQADWIYERLHFDPTPVDVALLGTSRMLGGLSTWIVETEYCKATGRRIHVANLAIPYTGRNMHYVLAKEVLAAKSPVLVITELNEVETRRPHAAFIFLADARDVLSAPAFINLNYLSDLLRLPGRQAGLFVQTLLRTPAVRKEFDAEAYDGPDRDLTKEIALIDGETKSRDVTRTARHMEAVSAHREAGVSPLHLLPEPLHAFEYRFARHYLRKIENAAAENDANYAYIYLPAYKAPQPTADLTTELNITAPIIDLGGAITLDPAKWLDATHVNYAGAKLQSLRFAKKLAGNYPALGAPGDCPAD